ncbi:MAG: hypothetical protein QOE36_1180, partial [Gaiellaceae bacterium]|nr:hypothetical protein [Gaiellaceae bacterium]
AMDDPELDIRRSADEPLFGYGSFEVIDNLTLLYSHRYFHENAASAAERARVQERPFAIVLVRLADMERINREDGFSAGDEALQKVARAVQRGAGDCGGTACRVSGRTLGVVIPGADETSTDQCVEEISSQLGDSPSVRMSHAVGQPGEDAEKVIERARLELGSEVTA